MEIVVQALQTISSLGPMCMMPIIIFILGLIFRIKLNVLIKSALMVGIGFAGVNTIINWFVSQVSPSVTAMVENWGIQTSIMDVGWPARAAATWANPLAAIIVFVVLGVNVVMLVTKLTRTVMVDFWSYNHFIFTGALVWMVTDNPFLSLVAAALDAVITFKIADWTTPVVEDYFELEGVNFPTSNSVIWAPVAFVLNKIWDFIPGLNKLDASPSGIQDKFGFVGEPMFMGAIIGAAISLLAGDSIDTVLIVAMSTSATMVLTPRMMQILMEGLLPFADAVKEVLSKKFPDAKFTMGIDAALTIANDSAITVGIIMVPITLLLAAFLPGNKLLPIADIAYQAMWLAAWPVAFGKGNIIRGILSTTIITCFVLWIATALAPLHTELAIAGGFTLPEGMSLISTEDAGEHLIGFVLSSLARLLP